MRAAIAACLLAACAAPPERAHVWLDVQADPDPMYLTAARAWDELGFSVELETAGLPECGAERDAGCELRIYLARPDDLVETEGTDALSLIGSRDVAIDARVTDPGKLRLRVAHEVGHVLLRSREHASGLAIMAGTWTEVTDADRELACRVAELCD